MKKEDKEVFWNETHSIAYNFLKASLVYFCTKIIENKIKR